MDFRGFGALRRISAVGAERKIFCARIVEAATRRARSH
jgi:hypothetical protein